VSRFQRVFTWGMMVGGICFAVGFFGPIVWAPDANQGPLLGIFITGPLGFLLGIGIGIVREIMGAGRTVPSSATGGSPAMKGPGPSLPGAGVNSLPSMKRLSMDEIVAFPMVRAIMGLAAILLLANGATSLGDGGRGPAAAIALGVVAGWIAATGRIPRWFRRR
jgi:hypothetical protein